MAPHGLRCMHPNRYSNRCEIIQPPSLMTAHMNSVSSEYPLWVNLHSSSGRAIRTHLAPRPPPPRGGRRSISHPRRLRSGGGSRISPCAPVPTTHRLGKGNVSRGTQCALPLARLCMGSRHDPLWSRVPTAESTEAYPSDAHRRGARALSGPNASAVWCHATHWICDLEMPPFGTYVPHAQGFF